MMFQNIMLAFTRGEARSVGGDFGTVVIEIGDIKIGAVRLLTFVITTAITIGLHLFLTRTITGKSVRAVSVNGGSVSVDIELGYPARTQFEPLRRMVGRRMHGSGNVPRDQS
jgi:hypothetical protein